MDFRAYNAPRVLIESRRQYDMMKKALLALCALMVSPLALAQIERVYTSATLGRADVEYDIADKSGDDNDTALGLSTGFLLNRYFGVEGGFQMPYDGAVNVSGFNLGLIAIAPVEPRIDVYGRLGLYWWAAEATSQLVELANVEELSDRPELADKEDNDIYFAIGGKYRLDHNLDIGLEYVRYDLSSTVLRRNYDIEAGIINAVLFFYY